MVAEVRRNKALAIALGKAEVVDTNGKEVDLTDFVRPGDEAAPDAETVRTKRLRQKPAAEARRAKTPAVKC